MNKQAISRPSSPLTHSSYEPPPMREYSAAQLHLAALLMFVISTLSVCLGISYVYCPVGLWWLHSLCTDEHYKYLLPLLVPVTVWFAIANWVGWEFFRFS
ncbi:uncharacterized protein L203_100363 [Cryptococcus depauperatus CBS 7841]|uniref:Transmembrane protein n=1 Tax=Cryptococcus depauperatus CBS 7841 TaxID=1295531 RepID=A0AAJ8JMW5_9TREE